MSGRRRRASLKRKGRRTADGAGFPVVPLLNVLATLLSGRTYPFAHVHTPAPKPTGSSAELVDEKSVPCRELGEGTK